ncbi:elongation factor P maturation arginine rhamnosyltransferase EarP [Nitrosomonas supralitoralis]|uniref:Protein-arginine rhamnosyltransferase n=1 Tax=Nitrosomonas supralitoralis TaxID=2116706 RepID=A0A2P7NRY9_9PROT|nr:elongation factor P maturation arginine rhamnosyltransferase EarP [Nitrosomonas supralitoralis]PSJ16220.1 elongation factor P maturation arginine rhamnosyltransferase EarP [Nitrosomonas supralitoralis]
MRRQWDIFCAVVDNYGDIGVCWRLAKQLANEHDQKVRLWIDDLISFTNILPNVNPRAKQQNIQCVEICYWQQGFAEVEPAEVVIEAFACELPEKYVVAMLKKEKSPVWLNLEYLSAESWVTQYHRLPSPHPHFALTKTFFFPGFVPGSGGLLREKDFLLRQKAYDQAAERQFLHRKGLSERKNSEIRISLFCYQSAPVENFIQVLSASTVPVLLIVPQGIVADQISNLFSHTSCQSDNVINQQQLTIHIIPFMEQMDYDLLLWSCDFNFVRGEDSFVRAQWASRPFIWNIYPQQEEVHWSKLDAFLKLYTASLPEEVSSAVQAMWSCWNGKYEMNTSIWENFVAFHEPLTQHNKKWANQLLSLEDLASNLVQFAENRL